MTADTQRIIDLDLKLWNTGNAELANQLYSEDAERTEPNGREPIHHHGVHQISKFIAEVRSAFPDFKLEMKQIVAEGDHIASHWTVTGTQRGEFQGMPATGKRIEVTGMTLARLKDGKIVSEQIYFDRLSLLEQLSVAPAGAAGSGSR
jgi:steroid delta-isomerase-like uncharacterized protein